MKKEVIWVFGILLLRIIAFFFGANYGKADSSVTGNVIYDNSNQEFG